MGRGGMGQIEAVRLCCVCVAGALRVCCMGVASVLQGRCVCVAWAFLLLFVSLLFIALRFVA